VNHTMFAGWVMTCGNVELNTFTDMDPCTDLMLYLTTFS